MIRNCCKCKNTYVGSFDEGPSCLKCCNVVIRANNYNDMGGQPANLLYCCC